MAETTYYKLFVTDNSFESFLNWRRQMAAESNSNMTKIDTALSSKADKSVAYTATLLTSAWTGDAAPYSQVVAITGLSASANGYISVANTATAEQREASRVAVLGISGQAADTLTIVADGTKPTVDIPVSVIAF